MELLIRSITWEAEGICSFELVAPQGVTLPEHAAGAHVDLHLPGGLIRQYSLTNAWDGRRQVVAVGRDRGSRGGSRWLHEVARPGMRLEVSAPRNSFPLVDEAPFTALFAGGIGITPIFAMASWLSLLDRPWSLFYGVRDRSVAAFADELASLGGDVHLHVDGEAGGPPDLAAAVAAVPADAHLYCCGPEPMIQAFLDATADRPSGRVHVEHFGAIAPRADDGSLVVDLSRSGRSISVGPDQTILDAVLAAGISVPASCRNGVCGTCETVVLGGEPDHRDLILSDAEKAAGKTMMICCSRAKTPHLTLDL